MFNFPATESHIAVGLSGGGDSLALAHMLCEWAEGRNKTIHLLTVNHNLRLEAKAEALQVGEWVKDFSNAHHRILTWDYENKPDSAIMEKARQARYELMADYCNRNNIQTLCIAHHADDQIETFFFRLSKGSGLDGLTGMQEWTDYNDNLKIYRPLLTKTHNDLIDYCKKHGLNWIEDPSNLDESYARPRLRKALMEEGFDAHRFTKTLIRLSRAQDALDTIANSLIKDYSKLDFQMLKTYPLDIQIRVLQKCLSHIGDATHAYPPKLERVEEIVQTIQPSKSATLYGCLITCSKDGNTLEIKRS